MNAKSTVVKDEIAGATNDAMADVVKKSGGFDKSKIKVAKVLTLPVFSIKAESARLYVTITSKMHVAKELKNQPVERGEDGKIKKREPGTMCDAINLETGEVGQIMVPSMLKGIFEDDYDGLLARPAIVENGVEVKGATHEGAHTYVGKSFHLFNAGKIEGKAGQRYNKLTIEEIIIE